MILFISVVTANVPYTDIVELSDDSDIQGWTLQGASVPPTPTFHDCGKLKYFGEHPMNTGKMLKSFDLKPHYRLKIALQLLKIDSLTGNFSIKVQDQQKFSLSLSGCKGVSSICFDRQNQFLIDVETQFFQHKTQIANVQFQATKLAFQNGAFLIRDLSLITERCHWTCFTCQGPSKSQCKSCFQSAQWNSISQCLCTNFMNTDNHLCQDSCPDQFYELTIDLVQACQKCPPNSLKCNSNTIIQCLKGYYLDNNVCVKCPNGCLQCTSSSLCSSCESNYILQNDLCVCDSTCLCPKLYYDNQIHSCKSCPDCCIKCSNFKTCDQIVEGFIIGDGVCGCLQGFTLFQNKCVSSCPQQWMLDQGTCKLCFQTCLECFGPQNQQKCLSCKKDYYLHQFKCYSQCPKGYIAQNITNSCLLSINQNLLCISSCYFGNFPVQQNYRNYICQACPKNCLSCNATDCLICQQGFGVNIYDHNQCLSCDYCNYCDLKGRCVNCLNGYRVYQGSCYKCKDGCLRCKNLQTCFLKNQNYCKGEISGSCTPCMEQCSLCSQFTCFYCFKGYFRLNNICQRRQATCLSYSNSAGCNLCIRQYRIQAGFCLKCQQNCLVCNQYACLTCFNQYFLNQSLCVYCGDTCMFCKGDFILQDRKCRKNCLSEWQWQTRKCVCKQNCLQCNDFGKCLNCSKKYQFQEATNKCWNCEQPYYLGILQNGSYSCMIDAKEQQALVYKQTGTVVASTTSAAISVFIASGGASIMANLVVDSYLIKLHLLVNQKLGYYTKIVLYFLNSPQILPFLKGVEQDYRTLVLKTDNQSYSVPQNKAFLSFFGGQYNIMISMFSQLQDIFMFTANTLILYLVYFLIKKCFNKKIESIRLRLIYVVDIFVFIILEMEGPLTANVWTQLLKRPYSWQKVFLFSNFIALFLFSFMIAMNTYLVARLIRLQIEYSKFQEKKPVSFTRQLFMSFRIKRCNPFLLLLSYFRNMIISTALLVFASSIYQLVTIILFNLILLTTYLLKKSSLKQKNLLLIKAVMFPIFQGFLLIQVFFKQDWVDWSTTFIILVLLVSLIYQSLKNVYRLLKSFARIILPKQKKTVFSNIRRYNKFCVLIERRKSHSK